MPSLNLNGKFVDLKARADNKGLREIAARAITERDAFRARVEAQHAVLEQCLELLCESRTALNAFGEHGFVELRARITELVGDGDALDSK